MKLDKKSRKKEESSWKSKKHYKWQNSDIKYYTAVELP
jgi:hypothetical protein